MKRAFTFLVLGPTAVVMAHYVYIVTASVPWSGVQNFVAMCLFAFTFVVGAIAALVDSLLARTLPALARAPLIALVGAAIPLGVIVWFHGCVVDPRLMMQFGIGGALCMGACSLLSHDCGQRRPAAPIGA